jgi:hypothetical protein
MSDEQVLMLNQLLSMVELQTRTTQSIFNEMTTFTAQFRFQTQIPPQVLLQQPVVFRDALDRVTPVHLDFIDSAEVSFSLGVVSNLILISECIRSGFRGSSQSTFQRCWIEEAGER